MDISINVAIDQLTHGLTLMARHLKRAGYCLRRERVRARRCFLINNQRKRNGKPVYRTRAYLKALQNERR